MTWNFQWFYPGQATTENPYPIVNPPRRVVRYQSFTGASTPPYIPVNNLIPFQPGSQRKFVDVQENEVDLRILFKASSDVTLWNNLAAQAYRFNPLRGIGKLQVTNPSGSVRRLNATCISGFRIDESSYWDTSIEAGLTFYANDPFWYSATLHNVEYDMQGEFAKWFPIFPLVLGSDNAVQLDVIINNAGDQDTLPTFVFRGAGANIKITNNTLNARSPGSGYFPLTANGGVSLVNNQILTCNFKDKTIIKGFADPTSEIDKLTYQGNFWPLVPGDNTVRIRVEGSNENTRVTAQWRDAYSGVT